MPRRPPPPVPLLKNAGRPPGGGKRPREIRFCRHHGNVPFGNYRRGPSQVAEAGGCCAICAYAATVYNLHFHHVDPTQKSFSVNTGLGKSLAKLRAEAAKCVLVCANCHGEIETGLIASPPPRAKFGEDWTAIESFVPAPDPQDSLGVQLALLDSGENV